jgi:ribose 5-phosphate isomerase A
MDENELRKSCAKKAMEYIKNNSIIGLGAGRNIACLIEQLSKEIKGNGLKVKVVTPSESTRRLCFLHGIEVLDTSLVEMVDTAFDGCGEVDEDFCASKGDGGVYTKEKIIGAMAKNYILLIDEKKWKRKLSEPHVISIEVIKDSLAYVCGQSRVLGGEPVIRETSRKDGYLVTDHGNLILDVKFSVIEDFAALNAVLEGITGVITTSLFTKEVNTVLIAAEKGVRTIRRKTLK